MIARPPPGNRTGAPTAARPAGQPNPGDEALLRFPAALETLEADFWQQYNELGGVQDHEVPGGSGNKAYTKALTVLDSDMPQYIHDNTEDEITHFTFLNAYLKARAGTPVNLESFRTLRGSQATGAAKHRKRLTNLMKLTVDTTWWTRYRSRNKNPFTSRRSSRAATASIPRSRSEPTIPRCCAFS